MWEEGLRVARALHDRGAVHRARTASSSRCRRATSCPKPRQKPHPPVWVACSRRDTIHLAAQKGIGALAFAFVDPEEARHWVDDYYATLADGRRPDRRRGERADGVRHDVHVPRGRGHGARARARGRQLLRLLARALLRVRPARARHAPTCGPSTSSAGPSTASTPRRSPRPARTTTGSAPRSCEDGIGGLRGAVGTPDQIREYLLRYEECGVDQVIFCSQAGKNRHEHIMESLELFGREVLPEFKDRDEKAARDKAQRLEPVIEQVMARKPASDHPPLPIAGLRRSRRSRGRSPTGPARTTSTPGSTSSPSSPPPGESERAEQLLG